MLTANTAMEAIVTRRSSSAGAAEVMEDRAVVRRWFLPALMVVVTLLEAFGGASAGAVVAKPHWSARTIALPTRFSPAHHTDKYVVLVTNTGAAASNAEVPVVIKENLSSEVGMKSMVGKDWASGEELECGGGQCEDHAPVPPDDTLAITVEVAAIPATGSATSSVTVSGGGAETVEDVAETAIGSEPVQFAINDFAFSANGLDGAATLQAGGHPYEQTTSFDLVSEANEPSQEDNYRPAQNPRDVTVTLPEGFVGNPLSAPRCPVKALEEARFNEHFETVAPCPKGSRVGLVTLVDGRSGGAVGTVDRSTLTTPLYNLTPEAGHPAEFGFSYQRKYAIVLYADLVHTSAGYRVRVSVPGVPVVDLDGTVVTLFGNPGARDEEVGANGAFLTNPAQCTGEPLSAKLEVDSWEEPGKWLSAESVSYPRIEGCDLLRFSPEVQVRPEPTPPDSTPGTAQVDSPGGYEVDLSVPRSETPWNLLSSPELKGATVTFPPGLSISPSAADGLEGCDATGSNGIDIPHGMAHPDEAGEGEAIGADGLSHLTAGHCPSKSQVGEVEVDTPLLEHPLTGALYLASPACSPCSEAQAENGEMVGMYIEVHGSGVDVKLKGSVEVGGKGLHNGLQPGQLRAKFLENPELPVSEIKVRLNGGPRAPLASPQTCGTVTTTTELEPWSVASQMASPMSSFEVVGCPASQPFNPAFTAGTVVPLAGGSSPFTMTLSRRDGEQNLSAVSLRTPPGVAALLASVPLCSEPEASLGTCSSASEVGHVHAAAGSGSHPFWVEGTVYLTGPYKGAPFGFTIVVPAKAGPFDLGNVVVRTTINVDPHTGAAIVVSDPLPQMVDGVPLRVKTISVTLDRAGFMLNPTNCSQLQISGTVAGVLPSGASGSVAPVSAPYAVAGCKGLSFKPKFTVSTGAKASKANGASLHVQVRVAKGEANIAKVKVDLPKQLPSRLTTLQKACTAAVFEANPASCPTASLVGSATAITPVLKSKLAGPAYLVSHGGAAFPDLDIVLQGEGVTIILTGNTTIKKGVTSSTFKTVPDAPVSKFDLVLPAGPHSVLAAFLSKKAKGSMCGQALAIPNVFTGQNGAELRQTSKITVTGCPKHKKTQHRR